MKADYIALLIGFVFIMINNALLKLLGGDLNILMSSFFCG